MTDLMPPPPDMGTLHHLDDHRPTPVDLTKPTTPTDAPTDGSGEVAERVPITGVVVNRPGRARLDRLTGSPAVRRVRVVVTHPRTRTAARLAVRHSMYTASGAVIVGKRAWDGRTTARYERMMRTAEAAGQHEVAMEWEQRAAAFRAARHQRRMDMLTAPVRIARSLAVGTAATAGTLLGLGIVLAIAEHRIAQVIAPTMTLIELVQTLVVIATVVWGPMVAVGPWLALLGLWAVGRNRQAAPPGPCPPPSATPRVRRSPRRLWSPRCGTSVSQRFATPSRTWATPGRGCSRRS